MKSTTDINRNPKSKQSDMTELIPVLSIRVTPQSMVTNSARGPPWSWQWFQIKLASECMVLLCLASPLVCKEEALTGKKSQIYDLSPSI